MIQEIICDNLKKVDVEKIDLKHSYLHYTDKLNIEGINDKGLMPLKGESSTGIEKTKKVFFTVGSDNFIVLLDIWLKWLLAKGVIDLPGKRFDTPIYHFFAKIIKFPFFPKFLVNIIVKIELNTNLVKKKVYKQFKNIMENSVLLKLDLENGIDFDFEDYDEVKNQSYNRNLLKMIYTPQSNVKDIQMEYWNMHTKTDKLIEKDKIAIISYQENYELYHIVEYFKKNSSFKLKHKCPYLYNYYKWLEKNS